MPLHVRVQVFGVGVALESDAFASLVGCEIRDCAGVGGNGVAVVRVHAHARALKLGICTGVA